MTNGVVSVLRGGVMAMKIVVGCDGYNAKKLAESIQSAGKVPTPDQADSLAREHGFGCHDCRVIQTPARDHFSEELSPRYRETFNDPEANPRWEHDAEHTVMIYLPERRAR